MGKMTLLVMTLTMGGLLAGDLATAPGPEPGHERGPIVTYAAPDFVMLQKAVIKLEVLGAGINPYTGQPMAWSGSAWHIGDGYYVTNKHVTDGMLRGKASMAANRYADVTLIGQHDEYDVAVIHIAGTADAPALRIASDLPRVGDDVWAVGAPFGFDDSITRGIVSFVHRQLPDHPGLWIQTDTTVNPGNSGGCLVNARGDVVALNTLGWGPWGLNMSIAAATLREALRDIESEAGVEIV